MVRIFKENSTWRALLASITLNSIGFGLYRGVIDNYLAESVQMGEFGKGVTEFFRELPGVMLIVILAVLFRSTAARIYKIGGLLMLAGMAMQASIAPSKVLVTLAILIYSTGEHIQLGMKNTLTLEYAAEGKSGHALGWQSAVYQIGKLLGRDAGQGPGVLLARDRGDRARLRYRAADDQREAHRVPID